MRAYGLLVNEISSLTIAAPPPRPARRMPNDFYSELHRLPRRTPPAGDVMQVLSLRLQVAIIHGSTTWAGCSSLPA